jgi:hypothetical protein
VPYTQQDSEGKPNLSSARRQIGAAIAREGEVEKEHRKGMSTRAVHPIDTLLVQQLEHILDGEKALHARYSSLGSSANSPEVRLAFSRELSDLKERADRLYRFVNAMDYYGSLEDLPAACLPV